MLSRTEMPLPFIETSGILLVHRHPAPLSQEGLSKPQRCETNWAAPDDSSPGKPQPGETDPELEDVARRERDYVRQELREELEREPTEEEVDQWLRQHTEGY
ncbi:MAG TPA: hypothetical protein VGB17_08865 [Pyrinomonadaceae bacterium]|jgi:hypothetical protein